MREMDRQRLETHFYGSRRMKAWLDRQGMPVSRKRAQGLVRVMGLRAIYRRPRTSQQAPEHRVYPYLLRNARVNRPNQVWATDITYLPIARGFLSAPMAQDSAALDRVGGEGGRPERFPILRLPSEKFAVEPVSEV